jgi:hypothetical protein
MLSCALTDKRYPGHQIIGALLLLFVFFLPLHFHPFDENRQISQECSCYLGAQPQLASAASAPVLLLFIPKGFLILVSRAEALVSLEIQSDFARAPPSALL